MVAHTRKLPPRFVPTSPSECEQEPLGSVFEKTAGAARPASRECPGAGASCWRHGGRTRAVPAFPAFLGSVVAASI